MIKMMIGLLMALLFVLAVQAQAQAEEELLALMGLLEKTGSKPG